jgi:hypothetical protein
MRGIAYRRAQMERARRRAAFVVDRVWRLYHPKSYGTATAEQMAEWRLNTIQGLTQTRKLCSCMGCGNQRKYYGLSLAEYKESLDDPWTLAYEDDHHGDV